MSPRLSRHADLISVLQYTVHVTDDHYCATALVANNRGQISRGQQTCSGSTLPSQGPVRPHEKPPVVLFMAEAQQEIICVWDVRHRKWHIVGRAGRGMPELEHQRYKGWLARGGYSWILTWIYTDYSDKHTSNTVGQVRQSLTHIPVVVPCNLERKHCSAHSLTGWPNGSRQRAGQ